MSPKGRKEKRSILWNYYKPIGETYYAKCSFCPVRISYKSTSTNLKTHLKRKHPTVYLKTFKLVKDEVLKKTKNINDSDPLFVSEPDSPKPVKSNEDNTKARRSLRGSSNINKHLDGRHQEDYEALDTTEVIEAKPKIIRKVSKPRFALSWDSYQNRLCSNLNILLKNEDFVDLTLAAGGHLVKVHQLIMSIASPYLKEIIHSSPTRHPIIFLTNVSYPTLKHLLQYVYTGEVDITEEELEPFFTAAKALQIQGIDTEIDTDILKSQTDDQISDAARLPPDPNETTVEEDGPDCDHFEESQILNMPRSATTRAFNSPNTKRVLSKRRSTRCSSQTLAEELELGDLGDVMMDEDMVIVASEDLTGGVNPIEFYEVSRSDDPDPVNSPPPKIQTMLLNHYKYSLASTSDEGEVRKWRCIDHLKHDCQARTVTNGNTVIERSQSHNHPFHDKKRSSY